MRVWLTAVGILFVFVELFEWVRGSILPLPVYVLAGAFLAIASNYDKGLSAFLNSASREQENPSDTGEES